ncbi:MAG TPA: helix-turn-helix domain-containing protein [Streptosporangiaceae bacterium]|nr:helix-turn-helix domain-containing protein [Streptosporangiaceae bacterium]
MSIGEALADARHRAGLTVEDVSEHTYIRQTIIRSIESDDYSLCGGDFYARGYIRSIARVIGADPEPLIAEYDAEHRDPGPAAATGLGELTARGAANERRRLNRALLAGAAVVIGLGVAGYFLLFSPHPAGQAAPAARQHPAASHRPAASHPATQSPTPAPSPSPTAAPVRPSQALGPASAAAVAAGGGSGDNPDLAHLSIDGSRATAWHSDWYTTARFGGLASGTGLMLDMGHPVTLTSARIWLGAAAGARFQLRIGSSRNPADLQPVAHATGASGLVRLPVAADAHGRYVLVWFTRLPTDPSGKFQASVHNIRLHGRP